MTSVQGGGRRGLPLEAGLLIVGVAALGFNLRGSITSLPPVFPELQARLHLSPALVSVLAATPVICFGVVSGFAAPLARRVGEERALLGALVLLSTGLVLRAAAPGTLLFPGTVLAAGSIAVMNVLLSSLIKRRWPERAGFLVGLYITMLSLGAIAGSLLSVPLYHASGGSVPLALGWLAVPALIGVAVWLPQVRAESPGRRRAAADGLSGATEERGSGARAVPSRGAPPGTPGAAHSAPQAERRLVWSGAGKQSVWRYALAWQVTLFMGLQSLLYFGSVSWLPTIFRDRGVSASAAGGLLGILGVGNLALSLVTPVLAQRMRAQYALVIPITIGIAAGMAGAMWAPLSTAVAWMLILGAAQNAALGVAIYFAMARAADPATAASLSAMAQTVGYLLASTGPLAIGLLHSATGSWDLPAAVLLALTAVLLVAGLLAARPRVVPGLAPPAAIAGRADERGARGR